MKRREIIKGLGAMALLALLPQWAMLENSKRKPLHFVGLGFAGRNILMHIYKKGIHGEYTYLCYKQHPEKNDHLKHIYYEYPLAIRQPNELGKQSIPLTDEMKKVLSDDRFYIVFVGLGAYSGTSLISKTLAYLESNHQPYLTICTLPFKKEGPSRNKYAREKMEEIKKYRQVLFFDNERICEKYKEAKISEKFALADEEIYRIFQKELPTLRS